MSTLSKGNQLRMQPPIPPGIMLQNRYRVTKILGQGGFGRTYLAQDTARFNELCVIKEFIPAVTGTYALDKSKELFQREAAVLYQIQHPQIPQFRANFEQGKRLFLIQDYADGKTYADLIEERHQQSQTFSEAEVVEFLQQMLPVLEHIHSKGIIHRDIAPDNIILRQSDRLPVLIDFGVVKQGVAASEDAPQGTTVGKLGYSPSEQLQTGQVYPNSDLYALAVTSVVMMTGRKPEQLMDESTMTWRWHQWVPTLSTWFAKVLNRMLNPRPNNRYQSAIEVAQALRSLEGLVATSVPPGGNNSQNHKQQSPSPKATSRQPAKPTTRRTSQPGSTVPVRRTTNPIWNSPWALTVIVAGIGLLVTIGPFVLLGSLFPSQQLQTSVKRRNTPSTEPTPSPSDAASTPVPELSPTSSPGAVEQSERLNLVLGETTSKQGNLKANQAITYIIPAELGQHLNSSVTKGGVSITVLAPNKELLNFQAKQVPRWEGLLPLSGDYYIQVNLVEGVAESDYKLDMSLASPGQPTPGTSPEPTPTSTPTPSPSAPRSKETGLHAPNDR